MKGFDFDVTAGVSQSGITGNTLEGNKIHEVTFDGVTMRDFAGKEDPTKTFKLLEIKFSNNDGTFTHTVWEPDEAKGDFEDKEGSFGPQPSNCKSMMLLLKHLIDAVNPELGKQIDKKEKSLATSSWDALRKLIVDSTKDFIGAKTKIKLIKNNKGECAFPSFFANYSKEGKLYMKTNFIGSNIFWTNKELEKINNASVAKPTDMTSIEKKEQPVKPKFDVDLPF